MNFRLLVIVLVLPFLLAGCGGSSSGANTQTNPVTPATVGLIITDAAIDDWDQVLATITSVELLVEGASPGHVLFAGEETIDLLQLRDFVEVFAIDENVPPGTYEKIRLRLSSLELVRLDAVTGEVAESRLTNLVANGKIDLNPRGSFEIAPGSILFITLDFAVNSFKLTEANNGRLIVRPVIFVEIDSVPAFRGLARFQGSIEELNAADLGFLLCGDRLLAYARNDIESTVERRCVRVNTDADTGVFGADGLPITYSNLETGEDVTVVGRLHQRDVNSVFEDPIVLQAFTIEAGAPGTWARVAGSVLTPLVNSQFELAVAPAQGFAPGTEIATRLFPETRLFTPRGEELDRAELLVGRNVTIDAVLALAQGELETNELRAALIIVETDADPAQDVNLSGALLAVGGTSLTIATDLGDRCVNAADARIVQVSSGDANNIVTNELNLSELESALGALESNQQLEADILGSEGAGGCFDAVVVIVQIREPGLG